MKTTKPNTMSLLFRTHLLGKKDVLTISAFATFKFDTSEPRLFEDQELWKIVELNLAKDETFDLGIPKPRGEYLVYGSAFSQKPVQGMGIYASVGDMSKTLIVIGNRFWTKIGSSAPENFTSMPVDYKHAFGGEGYLDNPLGKGYLGSTDGKTYLPNIEDPDRPIVNKNDRRFPAGFNPYPIDWPQRMQYMGPINDNYLQEYWPGFPGGTNPEIFNTAPIDQRLKGYFLGDEKIIIKNMHHKQSTQFSQLPGLRARIFIVQTDQNGQELFKELSAKPETLWLFPNQEAGVLLFRASTNVIDEEYSDVSQLYAVWESMSEAELPIEFYAQQLFIQEEPTEELVAENASEEEPIVMDEPESGVPEDVVEDKNVTPPELKEALKSLQDVQDKIAGQLKDMGADPAKEIEKIMNPASKPNAPLPDLNSALKQLEQINQNIIKKNNLAQADIDKVLNKANQSASNASLSEVLQKFQQSEANIPSDLKGSLSELGNLIQSLKASTEEENEEQVVVDDETEPPQIPIVPEPVLASKELTRMDVINQYNEDKNLSNLDLSNLDLSGLDLQGANFSNSILHNTALKDSNLDNAIFESVFTANADFTKASLCNAQISNSYIGKAMFKNANMCKIIVIKSDLSGSNFNGTVLQDAQFTEVNLDQSSITNCNCQKAAFTRCIMTDSNLSNANFTQANLTGSDLSLANLDNTRFNSVIASELKLGGCIGNSTDFRNANLAYSRADETTNFFRSSFKGATITLAGWEGAQLPENDFSNAVLDESNFSNTNLIKSRLELVSAKQTDFSKAVLEGADLNRVNLFKGSLRRANLLGTDLRYSNLYGVDFYKATMGQTDFTGANLDQTLLSAMGVRPNIV